MHRPESFRSYPYSYRAMASEWQRTAEPQFGNPAFMHTMEFPRELNRTSFHEPPHIYEEVGPPDLPPTLPPSYRGWPPSRFSQDTNSWHIGPDAFASNNLNASETSSNASCCGPRQPSIRGTQWQSAHTRLRGFDVPPRHLSQDSLAAHSSICGITPHASAFDSPRPLSDTTDSNGGVESASTLDAACRLPRLAGSSVVGSPTNFASTPVDRVRPTDVERNARTVSDRSQPPGLSSIRVKRGFRSLSPFAFLGKGNRDSTHSMLDNVCGGSGSDTSKQRGPSTKCWIIGAVVTLLLILVISTAVGVIVTYLVPLQSSIPRTTTSVQGAVQILGGSCSTFISGLNVPGSAQWVQCAGLFTSQLDAVYRRSNASSLYNYSEVLRFRPGSVIVDFLLQLTRPVASSGSGDQQTPSVSWLTAILKAAAAGGDRTLVSIFSINGSSIALDASAMAGTLAPYTTEEPSSTNDATSILATAPATSHPFTTPAYTLPPQSGVCEPVTVPECQQMHWNKSGTTFPNFVGEVRQEDARTQVALLSLLISRCYPHLDVFVCAVYTPKCNSDGSRIPPCQRMCQDALDSCAYWLTTLHVNIPLNCSLFPNSSDPEVCVNEATPVTTCSIGSFRCDNSTCHPLKDRCDNVSDCRDGTDEKNCESFTCRSDQFRCANNACRPLLWRCDGHDDCGDNSDELDCKPDDVCPINMFHCKKGGVNVWDTSSTCIRSLYTCDGNNDCSDNSDEDPTYCRGRSIKG